MKYLIKPLPHKKSNPKWKLQLRSFKKEDIEEHRKKHPTHIANSITKDIKKEKLWEHGFDINLTVDEAKELAKQKNLLKKRNDERKKRMLIAERFREEDEIECAHLPPLLVSEFEEKKLRQKYGMNEEGLKKSKIMSHWRAAKRVIRDLQIDVCDWEDESIRFYNYFRQNEWSLSYVEKVLSILNKWGHFCARKQRSPFLPIPKPRGQERHEISDSYYDSGKTSKESAPLSIQLLESAKSSLKEEHFNWLYISLQFGLRPSEVDSLKQDQGKTWKETNESGYKVINVYQPKLKGIDRSKRWKKIPCLFKEQERALELIYKGQFKRPLVKTIKLYIGDEFTTYAGRKGFEKYLLNRNIPFEAISSYLGHQSVDRTWRNYRDKGQAIIPQEFKSKSFKRKTVA